MNEQEHFDQDIYDESVAEYARGRKEFELGNYQNALSYFEISLRLHEHYGTYYRISKTLTALGRGADALVAMRKAYICNPRHSEVATAYAEMLVSEGDVQTAINILNAVIEHNSTYNPAKRLLNEIQERGDFHL